MIGKISKGGSFGGCISYVLEDKKLTEKEKLEKLAQGLDYHNRAEVIMYNKCFGDKAELINDFNEVRALNQKVGKPVLHISLRLADGELLDKRQLMETAEACSRQLGFAGNQYITVLHRDTKGQHIHIVANRVGFDGKLVSDANDFRKIALLCRSLEEKYKLQKVLSPQKFLSGKQQSLPRHNQRKEKLANDIRNTLRKVKDYASFEGEMNALGYRILKGRGICFIDEKKARFKGSEVGFSLAKIEKILSLQQQLEDRIKWQSENNTTWKEGQERAFHREHQEQSGAESFFEVSVNIIQSILGELLRPVPQQGGNSGSLRVGLSEEELRRRKKPRPNW